ncbi:class II fructose-bisphosphate aldolase [Enterococcus pallens]|uniref:Uncharacterized protein n=1 Tax=Enterococcus pallens ATCC BAA-351 TaxID=1158607 RepID=R2SJS3_9ENTE|nr:class II fructose-bisphosphate aldolase [Enterococcus pallens]EOH88429.1 hypothetical protein UAU_04247 [Enterococcus pallens ATCC BAA-351]EOU17610.1 hypothetical protein I588_02596 [Enterococcus pallens ATCC BAA-351]OJG81483.1 hypothetical protein RV10_GL002722 [Enterococcus pallens]
MKDLNENYLIDSQLLTNKNKGYILTGAVEDLKVSEHFAFEERIFFIVKFLLDVEDWITYEEIVAAIQTPLVLHGGSSSGDENLKRCGLEGISKMNIFSDLINAAQEGISKEKLVNYLELKKVVSHSMKSCLRHYYKVFST